MFCKHCGGKIEDNAVFCDHCGKSQKEQGSNQSASAKTAQFSNIFTPKLVLFLIVNLVFVMSFFVGWVKLDDQFSDVEEFYEEVLDTIRY